MTSTKYKLGELIEQLDGRNVDGKFKVDDVRGISTSKEFITTKADMDGVSLTSYKVVGAGEFAFVPDTSRRGDKMSLAYNNSSSSYIVSSISCVFKVNNQEKLLPDYLYIYFNRPEFDRYARFNSWGSARETFAWEDMCDIEIDLPPVEIQKKYVDIYNAMIANQTCYERGLEDLKLVYDGYMDNLKRNDERIRVGDVFDEIDRRNTNNAIEDVRGINIEKRFIPTVADTSDKNLTNYKVVNKRQLAFSGMQTGRDKCIRIALYNQDSPIVISPAYTVLEVSNDNVLPEYVMMWFSRKEIDRLGWFLSDASIRTNLDMDRFYEIELPLPPKETQQSIVNVYNICNERESINTELKKQIKNICPILIKGSLEETNK